jgi:predicted Zn finger-like uncharacterized protein
MHIVCPSCSTTYRMAPGTIGDGGRSVRCTRCGHIWRVEAAGEPWAAEPAPERAEHRTVTGESAAAQSADPTSAAATGDDDRPVQSALEPPISADAGETAGAAVPDDATYEPPTPALDEIPISIEDAPPLQPEPEESPGPAVIAFDQSLGDIETVAARREREARRRRLRIPLPLLVFVMAAICVALIALRKDVVRHLPQMAQLYASIGLPVNLRGLEFAGLKVEAEMHEGIPVLVIEGSIVSKASMPVDVPRLHFALRNAAGVEVYSWTALPSQSVLEPGQSLPFRSRLASPPADGHDVQVRFFNRRDAVAGLR